MSLRARQDAAYEEGLRDDNNARILELWQHQAEWGSAARLARLNRMSPGARRRLMGVRREEHPNEEGQPKLFRATAGLTVPEEAVKHAATASPDDPIPVEIELYTDSEGTQERLTYWLQCAEDVGRARALVPPPDLMALVPPPDPLSILARICARVCRSNAGHYASPDQLFYEMMESGLKIVEIHALLQSGLSPDSIVEELASELGSSEQRVNAG